MKKPYEAPRIFTHRRQIPYDEPTDWIVITFLHLSNQKLDIDILGGMLEIRIDWEGIE